MLCVRIGVPDWLGRVHNKVVTMVLWAVFACVAFTCTTVMVASFVEPVRVWAAGSTLMLVLLLLAGSLLSAVLALLVWPAESHHGDPAWPWSALCLMALVVAESALLGVLAARWGAASRVPLPLAMGASTISMLLLAGIASLPGADRDPVSPALGSILSLAVTLVASLGTALLVLPTLEGQRWAVMAGAGGALALSWTLVYSVDWALSRHPSGGTGFGFVATTLDVLLAPALCALDTAQDAIEKGLRAGSVLEGEGSHHSRVTIPDAEAPVAGEPAGPPNSLPAQDEDPEPPVWHGGSASCTGTPVVVPTAVTASAEVEPDDAV
ncbi:hypothetical protein FOA52_002703 [Chlamydomonas sp. UWO 241]|nr:hypothetical protein FOA52_002703 [Chlamydomonas sp. UWO 241]